ncbi:MAG: glycosyltransferase family 2 protein [Cocleimonas sp.]|nr:glycosyltransferase family 2 protein [Sulfurovaceae bacterium]MCK5917019.1 glycosyltransferase family 2 protein [Cocleimonas sp.]
MSREVPRTLQSLATSYQKNIKEQDYEIILVENFSDDLLDSQSLTKEHPNLRYFLNTTNPSSPSYALNYGLNKSRGKHIAFCIDGARMFSPGVLEGILMTAKLYKNYVLAIHSFHLGNEVQNLSVPKGYNAETEDKLLESIAWSNNGYRLFEISVFAASSSGGWFSSIAESNCIVMPKKSALALSGYCEKFITLGGGYANLDFYKRAQALSDHQLVYFLGEGTFHQVHGGVATNQPNPPFDQYLAEYKQIREESYSVSELPENTAYIGSLSSLSRKYILITN